DRFAETDNADIVIYNQNYSAFREVGIGCEFSRGWGWFPETFGKMLAAATGEEQFADINYLEKVGDRIITMERAFNVRNGFSRKDDTLPERMLKEPLHTRGAPGEGQMMREQDKFLDRYYDLRGWSRNGIPTIAKIKELGLDYLIDELE
ncbi:aldehyde ferredoxin oxidoreductase C-terminal domain-containing protein, partial [Chloroflexota bacterium]